METFFDWVTVLTFMGIAGTFFYRVRAEDPPLLLYIGLAVGCFAANWLGNAGHIALGLVMIAAIIVGWIQIGLAARRPGRG